MHYICVFTALKYSTCIWAPKCTFIQQDVKTTLVPPVKGFIKPEFSAQYHRYIRTL